jgi:hydroxymethylglutaryl-CoA reductase
VSDLEFRIIETKRGAQLIVHLLVKVGDSMGANVVTRMAEGIAPRLEELTGAKSCLRILSNLAVERVYRAEAIWSRRVLAASNPDLNVDDIIEGILDAWALADADPFRAATHNKGIMNGIDAVAVATGNDFRALEAGAHAYAAYNRTYGSLTTYEKTSEGDLKGIIELPLSVATVGGVTQVHPIANISKKKNIKCSIF